jgi:hypothetical protein
MFKGQPLAQGSSLAVDSPDYSGPIVSAYNVYLVSSGLNNRAVTPSTVGVAYSFAQGLNNTHCFQMCVIKYSATLGIEPSSPICGRRPYH